MYYTIVRSRPMHNFSLQMRFWFFPENFALYHYRFHSSWLLQSPSTILPFDHDEQDQHSFDSWWTRNSFICCGCQDTLKVPAKRLDSVSASNIQRIIRDGKKAKDVEKIFSVSENMGSHDSKSMTKDAFVSWGGALHRFIFWNCPLTNVCTHHMYARRYK